MYYFKLGFGNSQAGFTWKNFSRAALFRKKKTFEGRIYLKNLLVISKKYCLRSKVFQLKFTNFINTLRKIKSMIN